MSGTKGRSNRAKSTRAKAQARLKTKRVESKMRPGVASSDSEQEEQTVQERFNDMDDHNWEAEEEQVDEDRETANFNSALLELISAPVNKAEVILAHKPEKRKKEQEEVDEEAKLRKLKKAKKIEKMAFAGRDHVVPQFDDKERKLVRVATKGVVTLFNVIKKQQKAMRIADPKEKSKGKASSMFKEFMQTVGKQDNEANNTTVASDGKSKSSGKSKTGGSAGSGWSVLSEDFGMGGNLKDWDKDSEEE